MTSKRKRLFYLISLFIMLITIQIWAMKSGWVVSTLIALGAVAVTNRMLISTKGNKKTRFVMFCSWGLAFAGLVFISNMVQHGHFICPSKIPLVGETAGTVPKIPDTSSLKSILPCPLGIFQNYVSSFTTTGFLTSTLLLSIKLFGTIFFIWLLLALVLGRSWCGWICPFGGLIESFSRIGSKPIWKFEMKPAKAAALRYGFLFGIVFMLVAATKAPSYSYCLLCPMKGVYHSPDYWPKIATSHTEFITYYGFILLFLIMPFVTKSRFWCAILCPLGALTSIAGSFSLITTRVDEHKCTDCKRCLDSCRLMAISGTDGIIAIHPSACSNCSDCMTACPKQAIKYYVRGTDIEVRGAFFPVIIASTVTIAVMLMTAMCKPLINLL